MSIITYERALGLALIPGWLEFVRQRVHKEYGCDILCRNLYPRTNTTLQARNHLYATSILTISLVAIALFSLFSREAYAVAATIFVAAVAVAKYCVVPDARELDTEVRSLQGQFNRVDPGSMYGRKILSDLYVAYIEPL